ncbi:hypothetical protein QBC46DRAFT_368095 [Diplogelasinospora grovesii]|uniref:Uncharacterized protein n=1 Tax=Diplogelasinospora grovesii TaxID=303347 RepID=A0AAN6MX10_9PEZI|nr:hypothetical protein QBC46DRAFT_368095 [Diplogelasinospora grovesii]
MASSGLRMKRALASQSSRTRHSDDGRCGLGKLACGCLDMGIERWPVKCHEQRNFKTISSIYNHTVYPNQLPIFQVGEAGVPSGLFSQNVVGRVDPVGNFTGFQDSIEYFFALSPLPQGNAASAAITGYKITEFTSACPEVAASVVYLFTSVVKPGCPENGKALAPLKQVAFWRFDKQGAVLKYDAWIPNLNNWVEATTGAQFSNTQVQAQSIQQLCGATQQRCTGANTQWASVDECVSALTQKPYGNYDEAWGDNIVCRTIHIVLTQVRPDVHCPHVGPTGGGKCVNIAYPTNYFNDESLYDDPLGETFVCNK